jgi:uncharacterized membrane protein
VNQNLNLKSELKNLIFILVIIIVILKIVFYKEPIVNIIQFSLSILYFSLLPGYAFLLNFHNQLSFRTRIILSFAIGLGIYAILGYYLNIILSLNWIIFLPILICLVSIIVYTYLCKFDYFFRKSKIKFSGEKFEYLPEPNKPNKLN